MDSLAQSIRIWLESTTASAFMIEKTWAWPAAESIHFIGLSLLIGTVGLFDLRLLGFARSVPLAALHRLVPWGVLGYAMNVMTGMMFLAGAPDQYMYNPAFQMKMLFMSLAGINVLVFYAAVFRKVRAAGYGGNAPATARIIGAASLLLWIGVMTCGRLLTFFRPPFHWCPWC